MIGGVVLSREPCPLCGEASVHREDAFAAIVRVVPEALVRCIGCGLVRRDPPLSLARATEIYNDAYYRQYEQSMGMAGDINGIVRRHIQQRLMKIEKRIGVGRLLDIGCGKGALLDFAGERGWTVSGVEVSTAAGEIARAKHPCVHVGPLETFPEPAVRPDFIHMNHVLEHLADPLGALRRFRGLLSPRGLGVIEVPNELENLFLVLGRAFLPERKLINPIPSTHQWFFNPRTFRRALETAGLKILRLRTVRWTIGDRSGPVGRFVRRAIYLIERPLGRAGNIEALVSA